jgi:hypothetical protein
MKCEACERGDHEDCGKQSWCDCDCNDPDDPDGIAPGTWKVTDMCDRCEVMRGALASIRAWSRAYPLEQFPEPDLQLAAAVLKAAGLSLDAISAHAMRHVIESVGHLAHGALEMTDQIEPGTIPAGRPKLSLQRNRDGSTT